MEKHDRKKRRMKRVRAKIQGTAERPRISVYRSHKYLYAQAIDDLNGKTLASILTKKLVAKDDNTNKTNQAKTAGEEFAKKLINLKLKKAIFDRGAYKYEGRIKVFAQGLRDGGITI